MKRNYLNVDELRQVKHHEKVRFERLLTMFILFSIAFLVLYFITSKLF